MFLLLQVQQTNVDDEQVARTIAHKLGDTPGVSYSEIANRAIECGRVELAIRLLDFEPKAAEQVPLLMKMKRDELALSKAIESGDTDLGNTASSHTLLYSYVEPPYVEPPYVEPPYVEPPMLSPPMLSRPYVEPPLC